MILSLIRNSLCSTKLSKTHNKALLAYTSKNNWVKLSECHCSLIEIQENNLKRERERGRGPLKTINPSQNFHRKTKSDGTAYILLVKDLDNFNRPNKQTIRQTNQLFAHKVCRLSIKLSKTNSSNFKTSNTHFLIFPKISQNWQKH